MNATKKAKIHFLLSVTVQLKAAPCSRFRINQSTF